MTDGTRPSRLSGPWATLAITMAIQALVSMTAMVVPAMAPSLAQALHVPPTLVGVYVSIAYFGTMVSSMVSGPLVLRFGPLRVSQAGLLLCALGLSTLALWPTIAGVIAAAVLCGLGSGPITPASSHMLARTTPSHRVGLVFSVKQTGVPLGGALAGVVVPALLLAGGLSAPLLAVAAGCLLCLAVAQLPRPALDDDRNPTHRIDLSSLVRPVLLVVQQRQLLRLSMLAMTFSAMQLSLYGYLTTYLQRTLDYSLVAAGAALSMAQLGGLVGRVVWGFTSDRWLGPHKTLSVLAAMMAASAVTLAAVQADVPRLPALILVTVFGASAASWNGVWLALVARLAPPGMASAATGGSIAVACVGVVAGPLLFSAVSSAAGSLRAGFLTLAVPAATAAWLVWREGKVRPLP